MEWGTKPVTELAMDSEFQRPSPVFVDTIVHPNVDVRAALYL